ncbi:hypothetical protein E0I56_005725 [Escherichia coli]|nr:hypothetical protein [Escherichia coli]
MAFPFCVALAIDVDELQARDKTSAILLISNTTTLSWRQVPDKSIQEETAISHDGARHRWLFEAYDEPAQETNQLFGGSPQRPAIITVSQTRRRWMLCRTAFVL